MRFLYDNLSRLKSATYTGDGNFQTSYSYDKMGNIKTIQRYGVTAQGVNDKIIDNLTLDYTGNQLNYITDAGPNVSLSASADFKDYSKVTTAEYTFNKNGAMTKDLNKGIQGILYNSLNLPQEMVISHVTARDKNYYTYTATGTKLRVIHKSNPALNGKPELGSTATDASLTTSITTDYVGNKIYEVGTLKTILTDNGYIEGNTYYFYIKDHLGNNRIVANASAGVIQSNQFYPFGMAFAEGTTTEQGKQEFKYNGKELDRSHELNQYDYSARYYDPGYSRFTTMDPLSEKFYSWSPYVYCYNNPMRFIDPTGMAADDYYDKVNGKYLGNDSGVPGKMRLIDNKQYSEIKNSSEGNILDKMNKLQAAGTEITINNSKIQTDLQAVADNSTSQGVENQIYLTLDRDKAEISSIVGQSGSNDKSTLSYYPAPTTGVNFVDKPGGLVLIGQVHGHPESTEQGKVTAKTMSSNFDVPTAKSVQVPIYGVDAMDSKPAGNQQAFIVFRQMEL